MCKQLAHLDEQLSLFLQKLLKTLKPNIFWLVICI